MSTVPSLAISIAVPVVSNANENPEIWAKRPVLSSAAAGSIRETAFSREISSRSTSDKCRGARR